MALDGTYSGLQASTSDFLNRTDLAAVVPDFITMATAQISRRLLKDGPVRQMLGTWSPTISAELTNLPADFMGVKSLYLAGISTVAKIDFVEPDRIAELKIKFPSMDGDPQVFSIVGSQIQFWPWTGGGTYVANIGYWQAIPALTNAAPTNWLLTLYPDAYLYTALIQSAPYLKDDARLQTWGTLSQTILSDIVAADKVARLAPNIAPALLSSGLP